MDLPKTIDILGVTYHIKCVDVINEDCNQLGEITYTDQVIRIKSGLPDDGKVQTLIHEVIHGIDQALGYPMSPDDDDNERLVQQIATGVHQTLGKYLTFSS